MNDEPKKKARQPDSVELLNEYFRNGGDIKEEMEPGRDCISSMRLAHARPDVLANALAEMGVTENGDDPLGDE